MLQYDVCNGMKTFLGGRYWHETNDGQSMNANLYCINIIVFWQGKVRYILADIRLKDFRLGLLGSCLWELNLGGGCPVVVVSFLTLHIKDLPESNLESGFMIKLQI